MSMRMTVCIFTSTSVREMTPSNHHRVRITVHQTTDTLYVPWFVFTRSPLLRISFCPHDQNVWLWGIVFLMHFDFSFLFSVCHNWPQISNPVSRNIPVHWKKIVNLPNVGKNRNPYFQVLLVFRSFSPFVVHASVSPCFPVVKARDDITLISGTMLSYQYGSTLPTVSFRHSALGSKFLSTYYKIHAKRTRLKICEDSSFFCPILGIRDSICKLNSFHSRHWRFRRRHCRLPLSPEYALPLVHYLVFGVFARPPLVWNLHGRWWCRVWTSPDLQETNDKW